MRNLYMKSIVVDCFQCLSTASARVCFCSFPLRAAFAAFFA